MKYPGPLECVKSWSNAHARSHAVLLPDNLVCHSKEHGRSLVLKLFLFCKFILTEERYSLVIIFIDMFVRFCFYASIQMCI